MKPDRDPGCLIGVMLLLVAVAVWLIFEKIRAPRMDPDLVVEAVPVDADGLGDAIRRAVERVEEER